MKTKYTKKQIQESIKHWQKVLESWDDEDANLDIDDEPTSIEDFAKYINKTTKYQPLSKGKLEDFVAEACIDISGIKTYKELCDEIKKAIESEFDYQLAVTDITLLGSAHFNVGVATTASGQALQQLNNKLEDIGFDRVFK